jgi:hypothetical protein
MKKLLLLSLFVPLVVISSYGQTTVSCPAAKPQRDQYRGDVKHRAPGDRRGTIIGANNMYEWPNVSVGAAGAAKHAPMPGSNETETFTLDAFLWQAKVEGNDCEMHLELSDSPTRSDARRVIVEIPPDTDFASDYQKILGLISQKFPGTTSFGPNKSFKFNPPVHMQITGFGFFDGVHKGFVSKKRRNGGHGSESVKTFWELHPAWNAVIKRRG